METEKQDSPPGLKRRILRGLGSTALNPVVTVAIQLGTVPVLLHAWGAAKYGDWLMLSAVPSYLSLASLGFGDASGSDMTVRVARGDLEGALETFQSSLALVLLMSASALTIAALTVWSIPWRRWTHLSSLTDRQAAAVILTLGAYIVVSQQTSVIESGYRCDGHFASGQFRVIMIRLVETLFATFIGVLTGSLLDSAFAFLAARSICVLAFAYGLCSKTPWLSLGFKHVLFERIRQLAAPGLGFVALSLSNAISIQGYTLLIGVISGPIAVTMFSTLRTLTRLNFQITTVIVWALWPELSAAFGAGDIGLARMLHRRASQASLALSLASAVFLWFAGPLLYRAWIRHVVGFDGGCFHMLLVVTFANSVWFTSSVVPVSTNAHHRLAVAFTAASALSLAAGWVLVSSMGISGAAWSLLLLDAFMVLVVVRASLRQLHETFPEFAASMIRFPSGLVRCRLAQ